MRLLQSLQDVGRVSSEAKPSRYVMTTKKKISDSNIQDGVETAEIKEILLQFVQHRDKIWMCIQIVLHLLLQ
jgi:hypothetical protein